MSGAKRTLCAVWDRAQMFIAFHRDTSGRRGPVPYLWPPKNACAGLKPGSGDQEAFVHLRGVDRANDVQLKLRQNAIIARRGPGRGWSGIEIDDIRVRVLVGDFWVEIDWDGTVKRETGAGTTLLEGDGSIIVLGEEMDISVSADGSEIRRRTADRLDVVTADGILSVPRKPGPDGALSAVGLRRQGSA